MTNRAGTFVSNLSGEMACESFRPAPLPPNPPIEVSGELLTKLIDANKKIATLEGLSSRIPNMGLFVVPSFFDVTNQHSYSAESVWDGF